MPKERKFVDGIEAISFMEGMVHLELFNYIAGSQKQKNERPEVEIIEELILTPRGFLQALSTMQKLADQLEKAGMIKKNDKAATTVEAEIVDDIPPAVSSPNWHKD